MVTKAFKLFTAGILTWKSIVDHILLYEHPPINCEIQDRFLLVYFGWRFLQMATVFGDIIVRRVSYIKLRNPNNPI